MISNSVGAIAFGLILAAPLPLIAQTAAPASPSSSAATPPPSSVSAAQRPSNPQPASRAQGEGSQDPDARHCLDLATNNEIIACAEKYRSHRMRK
jgi:hypothetical protein